MTALCTRRVDFKSAHVRSAVRIATQIKKEFDCLVVTRDRSVVEEGVSMLRVVAGEARLAESSRRLARGRPVLHCDIGRKLVQARQEQ